MTVWKLTVQSNFTDGENYVKGYVPYVNMLSVHKTLFYPQPLRDTGTYKNHHYTDRWRPVILLYQTLQFNLHNLGLKVRKPVFGVSNQKYPNQPAQLQRLATKLKLCL